MDTPMEEPYLIYIDGKIYDVTDFHHEHPGGAKVLLTQVGKDASDVFRAMHPESAFETLANYYVGDVGAAQAIGNEKHAFEAEMRALRRSLEDRGYFHANPLYYVGKVACTLLLLVPSCTLVYYYGQTSTVAVVAAALIMGLFWQQCGWLAHDFGHHQVFEDRFWNDVLLVFLGDLCQGFSLSWWKNKHNTHHASTNINGHDPDIATAPALLWDEFSSAYFYNSLQDGDGGKDVTSWLARYVLPYQTRYYVFLLSLARLSWARQSLVYVWSIGSINRSKALRGFEGACLVLHWTLFTAMLFAWIGDAFHRILFLVLSQTTAGYLISVVFALNHNGMPIITQSDAQNMGFYEIQAITGRDVQSGPIGGWIMGGLHYQIEHHLFPTLPRHRLGEIQPLVEAICKKHNVNYCKTSFYQGTLDVWQSLQSAEKVAKRMVSKTWGTHH
ncbi:delta-6 fatty acid desaturase [Gongronella butleri]|nr:delta-6 fatty acid desaturase [Gongronella butleri]